MNKVTKIVVSFLFICFAMSNVSAQVIQKIGDQPFTLDKSAVLELQSVTKGLLPPRMTTAQRDAIVSPANGLTIYNVSTQVIEFNTGTVLLPLWVGSAASNPAISAVKIANYTILGSDSTVLFDATAADLTVTLPAATATNTGKKYYVRKNDNSVKKLTFTPNVLIAGVSTSLILNYAKTIIVQSDGVNWVVIN